MHVWTVEEIRQGLLKHDKWVVRAIIVLYEFQTPEEQKLRKNLSSDGLGFDNADISLFCSYMAFYKRFHHFTPHQIKEARGRLLKYAKQITVLANKKNYSPR